MIHNAQDSSFRNSFFLSPRLREFPLRVVSDTKIHFVNRSKSSSYLSKFQKGREWKEESGWTVGFQRSHHIALRFSTGISDSPQMTQQVMSSHTSLRLWQWVLGGPGPHHINKSLLRTDDWGSLENVSVAAMWCFKWSYLNFVNFPQRIFWLRHKPYASILLVRSSYLVQWLDEETWVEIDNHTATSQSTTSGN